LTVGTKIMNALSPVAGTTKLPVYKKSLTVRISTDYFRHTQRKEWQPRCGDLSHIKRFSTLLLLLLFMQPNTTSTLHTQFFNIINTTKTI